MALLSSRNTLSTTREKVHAPLNGSAGAPEGLLVKNLDAAISVYVGGDAVTTSIGWELGPGESISLALVAGDDVWAIAASGTPIVGLLVSRV